jgi:hypothetical protein
MRSNIFFYMAVIQRLNAGQIVLFGITVAASLLLGAFGLNTLIH